MFFSNFISLLLKGAAYRSEAAAGPPPVVGDIYLLTSDGDDFVTSDGNSFLVAN